MRIELKVPQVGESITEVQIAKWSKQRGQGARKDETLVVIETDKVTVELPAPADGTLVEIVRGDGEKALVGEVIGYLEAGAAAPGASAAPAASTAAASAATPAASPAAAASAAPAHVMPAARRALADSGLEASQVAASGPGGRLLKEDVERAAATRSAASASPAAAAPAPAEVAPSRGAAAPASPSAPSAPSAAGAPGAAGSRDEQLVPMTPLRRRIAERLVAAQSQAALLTTFNEIDMSAVIALRKERGEAFAQRHGVKLGFMSFFVKASVDALAQYPAVNAEVRGEHIAYKNYCDIGVAVGGGKGLVVPILRSAERMSFAEVEKRIGELGKRAAENKIGLDELTGGTFTISNGGVYGSLLSTPIVNPPQSGILGLHAIQERPVVRDGQIVARPMMYVALTYDHRLVDGREAVGFLKRIKECVEDPARMLLEV